ncbi:MAG: TatD family hydrolase [Bacteroidota bacterium]
MLLIDTHTHLFSDAFDEDRNEVVSRAISNGIEFMLLPNIDVSSVDNMFALVDQFPKNCFPMTGLHPGSVNGDWGEKLAILKPYLFERKNVAVGEIGMDLYWDKTFMEEQKLAFRQQISWAKELKLPIVIHAREAFNEIFEIVDELNDENLKGVFHCFTGTVEQANHIINYGGFKMGIGGVVTYKNGGLTEVLPSIDPKHLILETDSPYLPPNPHRGKRNESSYIQFVADKLAEIYQVPSSVIAEVTTKNARELFHF